MRAISRSADTDKRALTAGDGAFYEQKVLVDIDLDDFKVFHCYHLVSHMTRKIKPFKYTRRGGTLADGAWCTMEM